MGKGAAQGALAPVGAQVVSNTVLRMYAATYRWIGGIMFAAGLFVVLQNIASLEEGWKHFMEVRKAELRQSDALPPPSGQNSEGMQTPQDSPPRS